MTILSLRWLSGTAAFDGRDDSAAGWIRRCRHMLRRWISRSRQRRALREIAEANDLYLLKDMGVSREEAFGEVDKPFWRQ